MIEQVEHQGFWFLPENPEYKYSGKLVFDPKKGAVLQLIGQSCDSKQNDIDRLEKVEFILGGSESRRITLHKCFQIHNTHGHQDIFSVSFQIQTVFIGAHFYSEDEIKFKEMILRFSHLDEWLSVSCISMKQTEEHAVINYNRTQPIGAVSFPHSTLHIYFFQSSRRSHYPPSAYIQQRAYLRIECSQETELNEYWKIKSLIENFLSLAARTPVYPILIEGITEAGTISIHTESINLPVQILYKLPKSALKTKSIPPQNMLFTYSDTKDRLDNILRNWFEKADLLRPVYNLYFGILYLRRTYLDHVFLTLMQAIESYHRRTRANSDRPTPEHRERIRDILNAVPHQYENWLREKLNYSNEVPLHSRIRELLEEEQACFHNLIPDKETFIRKVVDTRNYLTHFNKKLEKKAADGNELQDIVSKLWIILEVFLLKELGFNSIEIRVDRNQYAEFFVKVVRPKN